MTLSSSEKLSNSSLMKFVTTSTSTLFTSLFSLDFFNFVIDFSCIFSYILYVFCLPFSDMFWYRIFVLFCILSFFLCLLQTYFDTDFFPIYYHILLCIFFFFVLLLQTHFYIFFFIFFYVFLLVCLLWKHFRIVLSFALFYIFSSTDNPLYRSQAIFWNLSLFF